MPVVHESNAGSQALLSFSHTLCRDSKGPSGFKRPLKEGPARISSPSPQHLQRQQGRDQGAHRQHHQAPSPGTRGI